MSNEISSKYEVMEAAANKISDAAELMSLGGKDLQSDGALEDAVPAPTREQGSMDPIGSMHMNIAAQIRGPYREALPAVDEFFKSAQDQVEELSINVRKSIEEYRARDDAAASGFAPMSRDLDDLSG